MNNDLEGIMSHIEKLFQLLQAGSCPPLAVEAAAAQLKAAGFEELDFARQWGLNLGGKYFLKHHGTSLFAFTIGEEQFFNDFFRIAAAHTDYPGIRIKPQPDVVTQGYAQLNVEVYGGPILNTWLDRPLGMSGRVVLRSDDVMHPVVRLIDTKRPIMVIPNLAIHLNDQGNKGTELDRQTQLLPIVGMIGEELSKDNFFYDFLGRELGVDSKDILDYELWLYCMAKPEVVGISRDLVVAPRLDNLTSVQALLTAIIAGQRRKGCNVMALFDHEEVGSRTKQGAGSLLLTHVLEKICNCLGRKPQQLRDSLYDAFLLSVDVAQGFHPNYAGKMDITNRPVLNGGICIKEAAAQSYATDCEAVGVIMQLCAQAGVSFQKYVNRSSLRGGSTLGAIASGLLPLRTVDVGVPILAMHSAVETMGEKDQREMVKLVSRFFGVE
jgi:aspartyl aminopeptidase